MIGCSVLSPQVYFTRKAVACQHYFISLCGFKAGELVICMDVLLVMSIFWIGYGILGIFGIQNIPAKYKGHGWTKDYIRKQGITWLIVGVPWLAFYLVRILLIPDADLNTGIELLILIALSLPALITTIIWEKKYKALLAAETGIEADSTK